MAVLTDIQPAKQKLTCEKCGRKLDPKQFYTYKNKEKMEICRKCLTLHVEVDKPDTLLWIVEKMDLPWLPHIWSKILDKEIANKPNRPINATAAFGKYVSEMKLNQYKEKGWADSEELQKLYTEQNEEKARIKAEEKRIAYEAGDITEAEFLTYQRAVDQPDSLANLEKYAQPVPNVADPFGNNSFFEDNFISADALPDVGTDLTQEDKIYLALKWGRLYQPSEWVTLEKQYNDFKEAFSVFDPARLDTLKKICKTSLKMEQAIDAGDVDGYQKYSRVYDLLMKSGKFTEAQKKEKEKDNLDSVGQIVRFAETKRGGGKITRHKIETPLDIFDEALDKLKAYEKTLFFNDPTIKQAFENYIKKRENASSQEADTAAAKAQGKENYILSNQDMINYSQELERQQSADAALMGGSE